MQTWTSSFLLTNLEFFSVLRLGKVLYLQRKTALSIARIKHWKHSSVGWQRRSLSVPQRTQPSAIAHANKAGKRARVVYTGSLRHCPCHQRPVQSQVPPPPVTGNGERTTHPQAETFWIFLHALYFKWNGTCVGTSEGINSHHISFKNGASLSSLLQRSFLKALHMI